MAIARIVESGSRPAPKRIAGFDIRILLSGDDAQAFEVFLTSGKDGTGPAPHSHPWDETFYVLRGPVVFGVGEREQAVEAGTLLHVPGGERHWYRFGVEEGEFLSFTSGKAAAAMYCDLAGLPSDAPRTNYPAVALRHGQEARPAAS
jgi:quercetin dioxygenase-like cupin family protein